MEGGRGRPKDLSRQQCSSGLRWGQLHVCGISDMDPFTTWIESLKAQKLNERHISFKAHRKCG